MSCDLAPCLMPSDQLPGPFSPALAPGGPPVHRSGPLMKCPLSPSPLAFNLSQHQGLLQGVSSSHQVAKYWSFSFSNSPSNEYPGLISFRMDWLDLLAVQGALKSLLQNHISKASILRHSAFFTVQLSHPHMKKHTLEKTQLSLYRPLSAK